MLTLDPATTRAGVTVRDSLVPANAEDRDPQNISAVELFRGPSEIPAQFNVPVFPRGQRCIVIVIWSRWD
jgi:hypothetical protein